MTKLQLEKMCEHLSHCYFDLCNTRSHRLNDFFVSSSASLLRFWNVFSPTYPRAIPRPFYDIFSDNGFGTRDSLKNYLNERK